MLLRPTLLLAIFATAGCAIQPTPIQESRLVTPAPALAVPPPPSSLPKPYMGAKIQTTTTEEDEYAKYLWATPMFPDEALCDKNLSERLQGVAKTGSVKREWVTKPFLAWGGVWKVGAVVGPVEHLYSIIEAHVTWQNPQNHELKSTYSCYVQYARQKETTIWRAGYLKYGSYMQDGHKKYASGPAIPFAAAPSGSAKAWEPGIRYYKAE